MKLKKGQRLKVYATLNGTKAETIGIYVGTRKDGMILVDLVIKTIRPIVAHPKQCRKLVKK